MSMRLGMACVMAALMVACDPGPDGQDGVAGPAGQDGAAGQDGQDGADGQDGVSGDDGYTVLTEVVDSTTPGFGCDEAYRTTRVGVDNGEGGGIAGDGALQEGEVDADFVSCLSLS